MRWILFKIDNQVTFKSHFASRLVDWHWFKIETNFRKKGHWASHRKIKKPKVRPRKQALAVRNPFYSYPKRPMRLKWLNISPPGTYSKIMYKFELSCKCHRIWGNICKYRFFNHFVWNISHNIWLSSNWVKVYFEKLCWANFTCIIIILLHRNGVKVLFENISWSNFVKS